MFLVLFFEPREVNIAVRVAAEVAAVEAAFVCGAYSVLGVIPGGIALEEDGVRYFEYLSDWLFHRWLCLTVFYDQGVWRVWRCNSSSFLMSPSGLFFRIYTTNCKGMSANLRTSKRFLCKGVDSGFLLRFAEAL